MRPGEEEEIFVRVAEGFCSRHVLLKPVVPIALFVFVLVGKTEFHHGQTRLDTCSQGMGPSFAAARWPKANPRFVEGRSSLDVQPKATVVSSQGRWRQERSTKRLEVVVEGAMRQAPGIEAALAALSAGWAQRKVQKCSSLIIRCRRRIQPFRNHHLPCRSVRQRLSWRGQEAFGCTRCRASCVHERVGGRPISFGATPGVGRAESRSSATTMSRTGFRNRSIESQVSPRWRMRKPGALLRERARRSPVGCIAVQDSSNRTRWVESSDAHTRPCRVGRPDVGLPVGPPGSSRIPRDGPRFVINFQIVGCGRQDDGNVPGDWLLEVEVPTIAAQVRASRNSDRRGSESRTSMSKDADRQ